MTMEDSYTPPPLLKMGKDGLWQPVYNPTPEEWKLVDEQDKRDREMRRKLYTKRYCRCVKEVILEMLGFR